MGKVDELEKDAEEKFGQNQKLNPAYKGVFIVMQGSLSLVIMISAAALYKRWDNADVWSKTGDIFIIVSLSIIVLVFLVDAIFFNDALKTKIRKFVFRRHLGGK